MDEGARTRAPSSLPSGFPRRSRGGSPTRLLTRHRRDRSHVRDRRLCRRKAGSRRASRGSREARIPRLRLGRHLGAGRRRRDRVRPRGRQPQRPARARRRDGHGEVGAIGIGHTRWATHGRVSEQNAHPHDDTEGRVHIVLNGIVENFIELRRRLEAEGCSFSSETDAEVVAHLVADHYDGDLAEAVRAAYNELARPLRLRGHERRRARRAGRRPQGVPADRRSRRGRAVPGLRHPRRSSSTPAASSTSTTTRSWPSPPTASAS